MPGLNIAYYADEMVSTGLTNFQFNVIPGGLRLNKIVVTLEFGHENGKQKCGINEGVFPCFQELKSWEGGGISAWAYKRQLSIDTGGRFNPCIRNIHPSPPLRIQRKLLSAPSLAAWSIKLTQVGPDLAEHCVQRV